MPFAQTPRTVELDLVLELELLADENNQNNPSLCQDLTRAPCHSDQIRSRLRLPPLLESKGSHERGSESLQNGYIQYRFRVSGVGLQGQCVLYSMYHSPTEVSIDEHPPLTLFHSVLSTSTATATCRGNERIPPDTIETGPSLFGPFAQTCSADGAKRGFISFNALGQSARPPSASLSLCEPGGLDLFILYIRETVKEKGLRARCKNFNVDECVASRMVCRKTIVVALLSHHGCSCSIPPYTHFTGDRRFATHLDVHLRH
jgi:hypothetical protein